MPRGRDRRRESVPQDAADGSALLRHADAAMYQAKRTGRGSFAIFTGGEDDSLERLAMISRLREAVTAGRLLLHYQPIVGLPGLAVVGYEALVRWQDPGRGLVPPSEFVPLAEESGMIELVGSWVIRALCEQACAWSEGPMGGRELSFNVSPRELQRPEFVADVAAAVADCGVEPRCFTVEITESTAMGAPERLGGSFTELAELDVGPSLDDFGTGYSSLGRLRELPFGTLKIDRSLMRDVPVDGEAAVVLKTAIDLARGLGMTSVAEGVECEDQLRFLLEWGCDRAQGFLFGRPVAADEVVRPAGGS